MWAEPKANKLYFVILCASSRKRNFIRFITSSYNAYPFFQYYAWISGDSRATTMLQVPEAKFRWRIIHELEKKELKDGTERLLKRLACEDSQWQNEDENYFHFSRLISFNARLDHLRWTNLFSALRLLLNIKWNKWAINIQQYLLSTKVIFPKITKE